MGAAEEEFFKRYLKEAGGNAESALFGILAELNEATVKLRAATQCQATTPEECPHAEESAELAVKKVFAILGVDIDDPSKVEEFRMDLRFGRTLRKIADRGLFAAVTVLVGGLLVALWAGIGIKIGRL